MAISQIGTNQIKDDAVTSAKVASGVGSQPPLIDVISPTTFGGGTGQAIVIKGNYFVSGCVVKIINSSGTETTPTLAFNSTTQLTITTNTTYNVAGEPYSIKVTNPDGLSFTKPDVLDAGGSPTWTTSAGAITQATESDSYSFTLQASDPDGGSVTYAVTSGALPSGITLNTSTGVLSGTAPTVSSSTTFNFTVTATDGGGNATARAFSLLVAVLPDIDLFISDDFGGSGDVSSNTGGWTGGGANHNSSGEANVNADRIRVRIAGTGATGYGVGYGIRTVNAITIPTGYNRVQVRYRSITGPDRLYISSTAPSVGLNSAASNYTAGTTGTSASAGSDYNITIDSYIADGSTGWYFYFVAYGGQYANVDLQITRLRIQKV